MPGGSQWRGAPRHKSGIVMSNTVSRITLVTAALVLGSAQTAMALEASQFGDRFSQAARMMGIALSYDTATLQGETVTLSGFTIALPGEDEVTIDGDIVFEGVSEAPDGAYTAERATIGDIVHTDDEHAMTLTLVDISAEGIWLPAEITPETMVELSFHLYDRISAGPLTVTDEEGTEVFSVALFEAWLDEADGEGGVGSGFTVEGIRADLSGIEDVEAQAVFDAFGVEVFTASMNGYGVWWPDTGRVELEDMAITLDGLATLRTAFAAEGYTRQFYQDLVEVNIKMAELAEAGEELDEDTLAGIDDAMMASFENLAVASGSIRYEDDSLFMKVLDFVGAEQGVDGATFAAGLRFMVPMVLSEVEDPELRAMVTEAVNSFIENPQSFTISIAPEEPVRFSDFEHLDIEADPYVILEQLNVQVTAND